VRVGVEDAADVDAPDQRRRADDVTEARRACVDEQCAGAGHVTFDADARSREAEHADHCDPRGRLRHSNDIAQSQNVPRTTPGKSEMADFAPGARSPRCVLLADLQRRAKFDWTRCSSYGCYLLAA